jgi:hypothetical protein
MGTIKRGGARLRVGVLEILKADARPDGLRNAHTHLISRQYASITPQAVSVWCRQLGHATFYVTYYGQADLRSLLPADLDVLFISTYTRASALAYALAKLYRRSGTLTVIGGPHAKAFADDCLRFFDVVVGECDKELIAELLRDHPRGELASSGRPARDFPSVEERLPEIAQASFWKGRPLPTSVVGLLASVGCPYRCDFCTDWNNDYALLPLDRLEADLRFIAAKLPRVKVAFHDPNFAVKFDRVMDVLESVPANSRVAYLMESSLSVLRGPRVRRLRDTKCWYVASGVESWADYANKTAAGNRTVGRRKLEQVVEHFELIERQVPIVQANFIFGLDSDQGATPLDLTREFIRRMPSVWPNLCIPTPFGGTPLYDRYRRDGAVLETMPFAFYNFPYLVTTLKNYGPVDYYEQLIGVLEFLTSPSRLVERLRVRRGIVSAIDGLRILGIRHALQELRIIRELLRSDRELRAFHEGETRSLPTFYRRRYDEWLGRYAELLTPEDRLPLLPSTNPIPSVENVA